MKSAIIFVVCILAVCLTFAIAECKPFVVSEATQAWTVMQEEVKAEKGKIVHAESVLRATMELRDRKNPQLNNFLAEKHGSTIKVAFFDKDYQLQKTRYERDGFVVEEILGEAVVNLANGKILFQPKRVKIWKK